MNQSTAKSILDDYLSLDRSVVAAMNNLRERLEGDELRTHQRKVGMILMSIRDAMDLVVKEHPSLRPEGMTE